jgi:divalent metal cation (Fe/Co/Zn/Cd) transporter
VRFRSTGRQLRVEVHLLFPYHTNLGDAHGRATQLEDRLVKTLGIPAEVITHLEAVEDHAHVHPEQHYTGKPG